MIKRNSISAFKEAKKFIAGGVNSPVRSFKYVNSNPIFFKKGKGCYLTDIDDNKYIDCVSSWGPLLFGYSDKDLINSINDCVVNATTFGAPTILENEMAKKIKVDPKKVKKEELQGIFSKVLDKLKKG